jgi:hypothetical protein
MTFDGEENQHFAFLAQKYEIIKRKAKKQTYFVLWS